MERKIKRVLYTALRNISDDGSETGFNFFRNVSFRDFDCESIILKRHADGSGQDIGTGKTAYVHLDSYHRGKSVQLFTVMYDNHFIHFLTDTDMPPTLILSREGEVSGSVVRRVAKSRPAMENGLVVDRRDFLCVVRNRVEYDDGSFGWV